MFALVDCNNFYASCERVFNPKIENKPVIVLSNNDGCVIARSNESKALGVKMGEPAFKLKNLIEKYNISVFSTNFALYGDLSKRVMNVMRNEVNQMEVYSIDEAFLDFSDYATKERGVALKEKVRQWTGIPVSVGIAHTKVLSKVASHIAKKHTRSGVFMFDDEDLIRRALNVFPVEDLWGVGRKNAKRLKEAGIHTALQFRECDSNWIRRNMSVNGVRLQKELFGEVCYPLELKRNRKKNICTARSFGAELKELSKLKEAISSHANTCARKLREEKSCCASISVFINTNPFKPQSKQYNPYKVIQLVVPTNDSMEIVKTAIKGLESIYRGDCVYKKAGVIVGKIVPQQQVQLSLFDKLDREKRKSINKAVDKLNSTMGKDKVKLAVQGSDRKWKLKQEKLSPCYTTRLADMLEVRV
jgi:DNA polymerase V